MGGLSDQTRIWTNMLICFCIVQPDEEDLEMRAALACVLNELWGKLGHKLLQSVESLFSKLGTLTSNNGEEEYQYQGAQSRIQNSGGATWSQIR
jgi:hypothetical protein